MKYLLILAILVGCSFPSDYHKPEPGTCLESLGDNYGKFVIKHIEEEFYLTLQYDVYTDSYNLYGLGSARFIKTFERYVECPEFKSVSSHTYNHLKNRKLLNTVKGLVNE